MSLLEDALRRQSEAMKRQAPAAAVPPKAKPAAEPPPAPAPAPAPPPPVLSPGAASPSLLKPWLPFLVLAVCLTMAWFALRSWEARSAAAPDAGEARQTQPPQATVQALSRPELDPDVSATPRVAAEASPSPDAGGRASDRAEMARVAETNPVEVIGVAEATSEPDAALPETPLVAEPPVPVAPPGKTPWPRFAVKGIAYGEEKIVMLDTGEMLSDGERSRTGVRVVRVAPDRAWFGWQNETNALRKGETSDKPLQD